jgi:peptidoglycan LD-endopeptidase CwlK
VSRSTDLTLLHPGCLDRALDLKARIEHERLPLEVYEAARSPWRQAELFARGRTTAGAKVTKARAWESSHQYGMALDFVFKVNGLWTWSEPEPGAWDAFHALARGVDLHPLSFEKPHVEWAWNLGALKKGHIPAGFEGGAFERWYRDNCEKWGSVHRIHVGQSHPGAPPLPDLDARPGLQE